MKILSLLLVSVHISYYKVQILNILPETIVSKNTLIFGSSQDCRLAHNLSISNILNNAKDTSVEDIIEVLSQEELVQL